MKRKEMNFFIEEEILDYNLERLGGNL